MTLRFAPPLLSVALTVSVIVPAVPDLLGVIVAFQVVDETRVIVSVQALTPGCLTTILGTVDSVSAETAVTVTALPRVASGLEVVIRKAPVRTVVARLPDCAPFVASTTIR